MSTEREIFDSERGRAAHVLEDGRELIFMQPCPESVWQLLPGGPEAEHAAGEAWQYMGTVCGYARTGEHAAPRIMPVSAWGGIPAAPIVHQFRHRMHPAYDGEHVDLHITDGDAGPRVTSLKIGRGLYLTDGTPLTLADALRVAK